MNAYLVNNIVVAAENITDAFNCVTKDLNGRTWRFKRDIDEGEGVEFSIKITRLTTEEIEKEDVACCDEQNHESCEWCNGDDELGRYISYAQIIERYKERGKSFPVYIGEVK